MIKGFSKIALTRQFFFGGGGGIFMSKLFFNLTIFNSNCILIKVLKPLEARYKEIVENPNLKTIFMDEIVRIAVIDLLESFTGVVQGCQVSTVHQLFGWMRPTIASLVHLLALYHNYNQVKI